MQQKNNNDTDNEEIKDTLANPILEGDALRIKQLLEGIQKKSFSREIFLIEHTNAIGGEATNRCEKLTKIKYQ